MANTNDLGEEVISPSQSQPQDDLGEQVISQPDWLNFERSGQYPPSRMTDVTASDALNAYSLYKSPELLAALARGGVGLVKSGISGAGNAIDWIKTMAGAKTAATAAAPAEDALSAGLNAKDALTSEAAAAKATNDALYAKVPQDLTISVENTKNAADGVIDAQKSLPASFRSAKITKMAADLQDLGTKPGINLGSLKDIRSQLSDMTYNGEGAEKLYASRLLGAVNKDIEAASNTSILPPPSQQPTQFAGDLRQDWANVAQEQSGTSPSVTGPYARPDQFQGSQAITNKDVAQNLSQANQFYSQRMTLAQHPVTQALQRARPEEMASAVFRRGNVDDVNVAKAVLGQTGYGSIQKQFYNQLLGSKDVGQAVSKYTPDFLNAALGPRYLTLLANAAQADRVKNAAILAGSGIAGATVLGGAIKAGKKLIP